MNNKMNGQYSKESLLNKEVEIISSIFESEYSEYEKLLFLINREDTLKIAIQEFSDFDKKFIKFLRNSLIHGPQYQFKNILDQMYRYDVKGDILYMDFDIIENADKTELSLILKNSELFINSQHFDELLPYSTYNKVSVYGLTISIDIKNFNNKIKEKFKSYDKEL